MNQHPISITGPQLKRLWEGKVVQVAPHQLKNCTGFCQAHPQTIKQLHRATMKGTGTRIQLTPQEVMMTGSGWGSDAWNWFKTNVPKAFNYVVENVPKAAKWVKENVVDTPLYQEQIRPRIRQQLESLAESKPYSRYTIPAIESLGDQTGAFGLVKSRAKPKTKCGGKVVQKKQTRKGGSFMV